MVIALAAIIPILYLLLRDTKAKVFLKPTEFQNLPLDHIEVSVQQSAVFCHSNDDTGSVGGYLLPCEPA